MKHSAIRLVTSLTLLFSLHAGTAHAQDTDGDEFVEFLLPIAFSFSQVVSGAQGSLWTGELWAHNTSEIASIDSLQPTFNCFPPCPVAFPPGSIVRVSGIESNHNDGGAILRIYHTAASVMHFSARLVELSRRAQPTGVDIPIIREDQFFRGDTSYLGIPSGKGVRTALRVYDPRARRGTAVQADFLDQSGSVVATTTLRPGDDPSVPEEVPLYPNHPGFAAIYDVTATFPQLGVLERYHIRVTPLGENTEYWAFVSVTHDESQHVLLITAQP